MNLDKLRKMQDLVFQNALRLHFDSILLYNSSSFPSAHFFSFIALEELGKTFLIQSFVGDCEMYDDTALVDQKDFLKALTSHVIKQRVFLRDLLFVFPKKFLKSLEGRKLETKKQNSLYVGFHRKNGSQDLSSRLRTPLSTKAKPVRTQISIVNDYLLLLTYATIKGIYTWDTPNKNAIFNESLLSRLNSSWKFHSRLMKSRTVWLDKLVKDGVIAIG